MNINTNTLLTLLSTKVDKSIVKTIEKSSVDGKVDISNLLKEKNVQTLLSDLFKDLSTNSKNKNTVNQLLTSSKDMFDFKSLSTEVKKLSELISKNPKLDNLATSLKEFIVNIKNIDEKILKTNIKDSGVFLESKLLKSDSTLSSDIEKSINEIKKQIKSLEQKQEQKINEGVTNKKDILISKDLLKVISKPIENSLLHIEDKIDNLKNKISDQFKTEIKYNITKTTEQLKTISIKDPVEKVITKLSNIKDSIKTIEFKLIKQDIQSSQNNNILNTKSIVSNDLKAIILQIDEQIEKNPSEIPKDIKVQVEKIQTQIEFYQLLSYTSAANHTFLPFNWEDLDDADIKFDTKNKEEFSCQINLSLKKYGDLKVLLQLDSKNNLNINIGVESLNFRSLLQSNLQKLRLGINSVGVMTQSLNIFDINSKNSQTYEQKAYSTDKLNFGIDIKV